MSCEKMSVDQLSRMGVAELQSNKDMRERSCSNPVPGWNIENIGSDIDFAFGARSGWKSSQGGINSEVSEPVYEVLGGVRKEVPSNMSVAELQSYEKNRMFSGQRCDLVIGQSESSSKKCTVCTVQNVQNVTNLAKSRQIRCISADTKGGPSNKRGGGHALEVIQQFEESLLGKTDKKIRPSTLARKFGKIQRGNNNIPNLVNTTPTKRKLLIDQNIHTLISSFENTTANHLCGGVGGEEKVRPSEGGILTWQVETT